MFSQVQSALDSLAAAFDGVEGAPTGELRDALGLAKPLRARLEALETAVASQIASREKHGDGGAGVLHQVAAVPRSDAARNVRTAAELEQLPDARSALAGGEMCMANASRLARVARQTSPEAVQDDPELMDLAKTLPPDEFAQASARWAAKHQSAASLADQHRRNRRNRNVRFWNGDDGTVQMRGAFDAEMGARIQTRIRDEAERLRQADRRLQRRGSAASTDGPDTGHTGTASDGPAAGGVVRTRDQRMADALDGILTHRTPVPAALPDCAAGYDTVTDRTAAGDGASGDLSCGNIGAGCCHKACDSTGSAGRKAQATQIIVRADLADLLDDHGGIGEIAGTGPVPASVIDRLCCNADISVVLFGKELTPLYEARRCTSTYRSPASRPDRPRRRLHRLRRPARRLRSAPHHPLALRRSHQDRQPRAGVLVLPRQDPRPQLAGHQAQQSLPAHTARRRVGAQPRQIQEADPAPQPCAAAIHRPYPHVRCISRTRPVPVARTTATWPFELGTR